jgi:transposase
VIDDSAKARIINSNAQKLGDQNSENSCFGLNQTIRESGSSVRGKSRISKSGNHVRNLFTCDFLAREHNKSCREIYQRITAKGKSKKLALIAVANKLLKQSLVIAKSGLSYDENYRSVNLNNM